MEDGSSHLALLLELGLTGLSLLLLGLGLLLERLGDSNVVLGGDAAGGLLDNALVVIDAVTHDLAIFAALLVNGEDEEGRRLEAEAGTGATNIRLWPSFSGSRLGKRPKETRLVGRRRPPTFSRPSPRTQHSVHNFI